MQLADPHTATRFCRSTASPAPLRLRISCPGRPDQLAEISRGKTTIGSSPRCNVRIEQPGVHPVHLLIVEDAGGLVARRWAADVQLNGKLFDEAPLAPGDRLLLGAAVIEIAGTTPLPATDLTSAAGTLEEMEKQLAAIHQEAEHSEDAEPVETADAVAAPSARLEATEASSGRGGEPDSIVVHSVERHGRARRRKLRAAVRRNRNECRRLVKRIENLECLLQTPLAVWDAQQVFAEHERSTSADQPDPYSEASSAPVQTGQRAFPQDGSIPSWAESPAEQAAQNPWPTGSVASGEPLPAWPTAGPIDNSGSGQAESHNELSNVAAPFAPAESGSLDWQGASTNGHMAARSGEASTFEEFSIWKQGADTTDAAPTSPVPEDAGHSELPGDQSGAFAPAEQWPSTAPPADFAAEEQFDHHHESSSDADTEHESTSSASAFAPNDATPAPNTASFIDRYAHLFAEEGQSDEETPSGSTARLNENDGPLRSSSPPTVASPGAEQQSTDGEEETIEQYMAKLLQRVRGGAPYTPEPTTLVSRDRQLAAGGMEVPSRGGDDGGTSQVPAGEGDSRAGTENEERVTTSLGTTRRKATVIEEPANLEAFRALANESARRAIGTHAQRVHRRNALTKAIVATLAGLTSAWLMLEAPGWRDVQFIAACVSLLAAAYWAGQTYGTLVEAFRAASYDGPQKSADHPVDDPFHPSLPIDVE
jgi:hypothetical protein